MADQLCPESRLADLIAKLQDDDAHGLAETSVLIAAFPDDPRLQFLQGSLLAAKQDYAGARAHMRKAVDLAPDYAIARFQLGFLLLTSGEGHAAQEAWGPLHALPPDNYLRLCVEGLVEMIHDNFGPAIGKLEAGIAANDENPPLNNDMRLLIAEMRNRPAPRADEPGVNAVEAPLSSAQALLQQAALKATKH
jgi:tetratricopeptide (TPR) repeat protein